jgi:selenoprotein W-related protein
LTDELLGIRPIEALVRSWRLIPSRGGRFEVTVNGEVLFSKAALGRHAEPGEIKGLMLAKLGTLAPPGYSFVEEVESD